MPLGLGCAGGCGVWWGSHGAGRCLVLPLTPPNPLLPYCPQKPLMTLISHYYAPQVPIAPHKPPYKPLFSP